MLVVLLYTHTHTHTYTHTHRHLIAQWKGTGESRALQREQLHVEKLLLEGELNQHNAPTPGALEALVELL